MKKRKFMNHANQYVLTAVLLVIATIILSFSQFVMTKDNSNAAVSDTEFSTERAVKCMKNIAKEPHPMGSDTNKEVREYLINYFQDIGADVAVQEHDASAIQSRYFKNLRHSGVLSNIIAKIPGESEDAVMVTAHYDSTVNGPGAADDGYGVVTLLESARAIRAKGKPVNTIYFVLTDGEEEGMLGATALIDNVENKPMLDAVKIIINMEARGNKGIPILFETNSKNLSIIKLFQKVAKHPVSYSLSYDIYKMLPNYTDFTIYEELGKRGYNFANIEGMNTYHKSSDNIENMSEETIEYFGNYTFPLLKELSFMDKEDLNALNDSSNDAICFTIFKNCFIAYSASWVIPIALIIVLLTAILLVLYKKKNAMNIRKIVLAFVMLLSSIIVNVFLIYLVYHVIEIVNIMYMDNTCISNILGGFLLVVMIAEILITFRFTIRKCGIKAVSLCFILIMAIISVLLSFKVKGASYIFTIPTVLFEITSILIMKKEALLKNSIVQYSLIILWSVPALLLSAPIIYVVYICFTLEVAPMLSIMVSLVGMGILISVRLVNCKDIVVSYKTKK